MKLLQWLRTRGVARKAPDDLRNTLATLVGDAHAHLQARELDEARRLFLKILDHRPAIADPAFIEYVLGGLEGTWLWQDKYLDGIKYFSDYIVRYSNDVEAYTARAGLFWYSGQLREAIQDYSHALEVDPEDVLSLLGRGQVLVESGDNEKALQDLNLALKLFEQNQWPDESSRKHVEAYTRNGRAAALAATGDFENAFSEFEASMALCPNNAWVYYNRAKAYELRQENEKAISDYRTALEKTDPKLNLLRTEDAKRRIRELVN